MKDNRKPPELMSDTDLAEATHAAAISLSYYNAAEGPSWYAEAEGRARAKARYAELSTEARKRNVSWRKGPYLI